MFGHTLISLYSFFSFFKEVDIDESALQAGSSGKLKKKTFLDVNSFVPTTKINFLFFWGRVTPESWGDDIWVCCAPNSFFYSNLCNYLLVLAMVNLSVVSIKCGLENLFPCMCPDSKQLTLHQCLELFTEPETLAPDQAWWGFFLYFCLLCFSYISF